MHDKSLAGYFLVASRHLRDPNFARSVVLMVHHDERGAVGVVINRPSDKSIREVWEMIGFDPCDRDDLVYVGGPVPSDPVVVHTVAAFAEHEVLSGLYFSANRDAVDLIVRKRDQRLRLFSGHSGWGSGQLESELEAGGWLYTRANLEEVFADDEGIWKTVTQRIGLEIMAPDLDLSHLPSDPSLN